VRIIPAAAQSDGQSLEKYIQDALGIRNVKRLARQQAIDFREAGHTQNSLFIVRSIGGVDGCDVRGATGDDLGLIIDIGDKEVSKAATAYLERYVVRIINERTALSADVRASALRLRWYDNTLDAEQIGQMIYRALKDKLILRTISVNLIFDPLRISSLRPSILSYREEREKELARRQETSAPFILCRENRHYAPHGFVIASVDRPPPDGRSYDELAVQAQFTRGTSQLTVDPGICQDRIKGRYIGVDKYAQLFSEGSVDSICLHSLRESPCPTLGNPQCIAYYMDELDVICILSRDYAGRAPDGKTFETLLTRIAGRQVAGYSGISESYILSPRFFAAEGGLASVAWMNSALKQRLAIRDDAIATENEAINMAGLSEHMSRRRH
jgi:CO dehydrogenase/acetyl-CoA synthase beta subunit